MEVIIRIRTSYPEPDRSIFVIREFTALPRVGEYVVLEEETIVELEQKAERAIESDGRAIYDEWRKDGRVNFSGAFYVEVVAYAQHRNDAFEPAIHLGNGE